MNKQVLRILESIFLTIDNTVSNHISSKSCHDPYK